MTGIANYSEGDALNWFSGGKTEVSHKNNLEVVIGTNTEVTFGIKNEVYLGTQSNFSAGMKVEAYAGGEFILNEAGAIASTDRGDDYYMTSYATAVGASLGQISAMKKVRAGLFILLAAQGALMTAAAAAAAIRGKDEATDELDIPPKLGKALTLSTHIATITAAVTALILAGLKKFNVLAEPSDPAGILSIDTTAGVFLGARQMTAPNHSSGVLVNETGVQLSAAASDLGYRKPANSTSVLGFNTDADTTEGARVEISNDGMTRIHGTGIHAALKVQNGTASHAVLAQEHHLKVTGANSLAPTESAFGLSSTGALLQQRNDSALAVQQNSIDAAIGGDRGSAMRLTADESSIGTGGNRLTIDAHGIHLSFGGSHFKMDAGGVSVGNNLTVIMGPVAQDQFAGLRQARGDIQALRAALQNSMDAAQRKETDFNRSRNLTNNMNELSVSTRDNTYKALRILKNFF